MVYGPFALAATGQQVSVLEPEPHCPGCEAREARHLPGKHNQKTHGRRAAGAYIPGDDLLAGDSSAFVRDRLAAARRRSSPGAEGPHGDEDGYAIAESQGFTRKPEVVSREKLDAAIAGGAIEMHRGVTDAPDHKGRQRSGAEFAEQFRTGDMYAGEGVFGNGTYAAVSRATVTDHYRVPESGVIRMALRPGARVVDHSTIKAEHESWLSRHAAGSPHRELLYDRGHYAAARGYDAIRVPEAFRGRGDFYIILNRTAVLVEEA